MSEGITPKDDQLYAERGLDLAETVLFPEDVSSSIHKQEASYQDPDWKTTITYESGNLNPIPFSPHPKYKSEPFDNRDEALLQAVALRKKRSDELPQLDLYLGYEDTMLKTSKMVLQKAYANYSAKPVQDFKVEMIPSNPLLKRLGIQEFGKERGKLNFSNKWHKNGLPSYQFYENGKLVTLHDTVTSSNDRAAYGISMMRRVDSDHTGQSVVYTGRPDTVHKAEEQAEFIFRSEFAKKEKGKGIKFNESTGEYELTYVVNNLMAPVAATGIFGLNEEDSILREQLIQKALEGTTLTIDGKKVKFKPIYFNQGFNFLTNFGTPSLQKEINEIGYRELLSLARADKENSRPELLKSAIAHLEDRENLLPEEEFFYRDLLCKLLGLPEVAHCKSSTDRTIIAVAISMATQQWLNCGKEIPAENPHAILSDPVYKELFMSKVMSGHQVTRVSRSAEGIVEGAKQFSQLVGFEWGKNGIKKNYLALRMVPDRYTRKGSQPIYIRAALKVLKFANFFFNSKRINSRIAYLDRSYIKKEFALDSKYIKDRRLFKPSGMKMHYKEGAVHPRFKVKKP